MKMIGFTDRDARMARCPSAAHRQANLDAWRLFSALPSVGDIQQMPWWVPLIASQVIDHFGWLRMEPHAILPRRIVGDPAD
jgi:hypothetical protein